MYHESNHITNEVTHVNQPHILAVPAMSRTLTAETRPIYLQHLKNIGAQRIWIAFERDTLFLADRSADLKNAEESLRYFEANGISYTVAIFKDNGQSGATDCAPVFKEISEEIFLSKANAD